MQGHIIFHLYPSVTDHLVWASIHCKSKMGKQDLQGGKVDDRIPVLQLAKSRSKKQKGTDVNRERRFQNSKSK